MLRLALTMSLVLAAVQMASAHQDGSFHAHPHLIVTNEFLSAVLLVAAGGLVLAARWVLSARRNRSDGRRPR